MDEYNTSKELWKQANKVYTSRPHGGPVLTVHDGLVGDGYQMLARFSSQRAATTTLLAAGFKRVAPNSFKAAKEQV